MKSAQTPQPSHQPSSGEFFPALDGIRGIAILSVVFYHAFYFNTASASQRVLDAIRQTGAMGVPIFFVLSGFLISYAIFKSGDRFNWRTYAVRRAAKIYPPFLLSLVVFSLLVPLWEDPRSIWASALAYVFTLPNFTQGWDKITGIYWSLMIEMHFYVALPVVYLILRKLSKKAELLTLLVFLLIPPLVRFATASAPGDFDVQWRFHMNRFPNAQDNFVLGILFALIFLRKEKYAALIRISRYLVWTGILLLGIACPLWCVAMYFGNVPATEAGMIFSIEIWKLLPALGTFFLLFVIFEPESNWISRVLRWGPLQYLGIVSYEWFLFHWPPVRLARHLMEEAGGSMAIYLCRTLVPVVVTLLFAMLVYHFFSAPILARAKSKTQRAPKIEQGLEEAN